MKALKVAIIGLILAVIAVAASSVTTTTHSAVTVANGKELAAYLRSAKGRWTLELVLATNNVWAQSGACPSCAALDVGLGDLSTKLAELFASAAPSDKSTDAAQLDVTVLRVDCGSATANEHTSSDDAGVLQGSRSIASICGTRANPVALPALQVWLTEPAGGSTVKGPFQGVADALGIATFLQNQLPASYKVTKKAVTAAGIAPTAGRALLQTAKSMITAVVPPKEFQLLRKSKASELVVAVATAARSKQSTHRVLLVDTALRMLNRSHAEALGSSVTVVEVPLEGSVWQGRWIPAGKDLPQILFFPPADLNNYVREQSLPILYEGPLTVQDVHNAVAYYGGLQTWASEESARQSTNGASSVVEARQAGGASTSSGWARQWEGLEQSDLFGPMVQIVRSGDASLAHAQTLPASVGTTEKDPRLRHVFVSVLTAPWFVSTTLVHSELNQLLSLARRYDQLGNAVTASFTIVDLTSVNMSAGSAFHRTYVGNDMVLRDVCTSLPCVLTCRRSRWVDAPFECGALGTLTFDPFGSSTMDFATLHRRLSFLGDPTSTDDLVNLRKADRISQVMEGRVATSKAVVHHADSLRPFVMMSKDPSEILSLRTAEGPLTAAEGALRNATDLFVLFHTNDAFSATCTDVSRRAAESFTTLCRRHLNSSKWVPSSDGTAAVYAPLCVSIDASAVPKVAQRVQATFPLVGGAVNHFLTKSPRSGFVAHLSLLEPADGSLLDAAALASLGEEAAVYPADRQYRGILEVSAEMLALKPRQALQLMLASAAKQRVHHAAHFQAPAPAMTEVFASNLMATVTDPEKGVLVLYSGGAGCPHSAYLLPILEEVAQYFSKEHQTISIVHINAAKELDEADKALLRIHRLPAVQWFPKTSGKFPNHGEEVEGALHKLSLIEYISGEMNIPFHEMDWLQDQSIPTVSPKELASKLADPTTHTVLYVYSSLQADIAALEGLRRLQERFDEHPVYGKPRKVDGEDAPEGTGAEEIPRDDGSKVATPRELLRKPLNFYKVDGRRVKRALQSLQLHRLVPNGTTASTIPLLLFFPRGAMKTVHYAVFQRPLQTSNNKAKRSSKQQQQQQEEEDNDESSPRSILRPTSQLSVVEAAKFILSELHKPGRFTGTAPSDAAAALGLPKEDVEAYVAQQESASFQKTTSIIELTTNDFRGFVDDLVDVVVYFYAPWCEHCKRYRAIYEAAADYFRDDPTIKFGQIDVPKNEEIGHTQGILAFPHIKVYFAGSVDQRKLIGEDYTSFREATPQQLIDFLSSTRRTSKVAELDYRRELREKSIPEFLNETVFRQWTQESTNQVLVEFHAPWCGHCRTVTPELLSVAAHFRTQRRNNPIRPNVVLAKMDGTRFRNLTEALNISGAYPQIVLFSNEKNAKGTIVRSMHVYKDVRLADRMVEFVAERIPRVGTHNYTVGGGGDPAKPSESSRPHQQQETDGSDDDDEESKSKDSKNVNKKDTKQKDKTKNNNKKKQTRKDKIESMYREDENLKEVMRKRDEAARKQSGTTASRKRRSLIEPRATFGKNVKFLEVGELTAYIDTPKILAVLHCEPSIDEEMLDTWGVVSQSFENLIKEQLVVFGVMESYGAPAPAVRHLLGESPSITVIRGVATPQFARFKMLDPYDDHDEYAKIRLGEGGSASNVTEVLAFIQTQVRNTLMMSAELTAKDYEGVTQNMTARVIVMLYGPWSAASKAVAPSFDALAQKFRHLPNTFIARVDVGRNARLYEKLHSLPLPAILAYDSYPERPSVDASVRKIPRYLTTERPTMAQLAAFALNEVHENFDQERLVPYGDENAVPASRTSLTKKKTATKKNVTAAVDDSDEEEDPVPERREQAVDEVQEDLIASSSPSDTEEENQAELRPLGEGLMDARGMSATEPIAPLTLSSLTAFNLLVAESVEQRHAILLAYLVTPWCHSCGHYLSQFQHVANSAVRVDPTRVVAVMLNVTNPTEVKSLKRPLGEGGFGVEQFPAFLVLQSSAYGVPTSDTTEGSSNPWRTAGNVSQRVLRRGATESRDAFQRSLLQAIMNSMIAVRRNPPTFLPATRKPFVVQYQPLFHTTVQTPQPTSDGSTKNNKALRTVAELDELFARLAPATANVAEMNADVTDELQTTSPSQALIIITTASWCRHCGALVDRVATSVRSAFRGQENVHTAVVDVSDKAMKKELLTRADLVSAPAYSVMCFKSNGTQTHHRIPSFHAKSSTSTDEENSNAVREFLSSISIALDKHCFDMPSLESLRDKLDRKLRPEVDGLGVVDALSWSAAVQRGSTDASVLVLLFNGQKCFESCMHALATLQRVSASYPNRQLTFAKVDLAKEENKAHLREEEARDGWKAVGGVKLMLYLLEQPPVTYSGEEISEELLMAFLTNEEKQRKSSRL